jgi:putative component of membrane protein insertase Oxa1/YidC/SpoIIIJ protein YidD
MSETSAVGEISMPSDEEQEEAWRYVCLRVLERPSTNILNVAKNIFVFLAAAMLFALATHILLVRFTEKIFSFIALFAVYIVVGLLLFSKQAIIGLVKLYQHYAPEKIRRKCLFKPTCSEYMILALKKYGLVKGLYKSVYRVFFRCKGFVYSIDYP